EVSELRTGPLRPGESVEVAGILGHGGRLTSLGLSRYEVASLDKRVASFQLSSRAGTAGGGDLITAALHRDPRTGRQLERPALKRGVLQDVVVAIAGLGGGDREEIVCRCGTRPLTNLVWLGASLVFLAVLGRWSWGL
ncbi:MAG: hypothetical protein JSU87_06565, partial [Gemmatimonadota bacterium]